MNGDVEPAMTEIDVNEKKVGEGTVKTENKEEEEEKSEMTKSESDVAKPETEVDNSEAKVVADEAEKEKKVKKSIKTKDRILSSFR
jgi:hypothetical protein